MGSFIHPWLISDSRSPLKCLDDQELNFPRRKSAWQGRGYFSSLATSEESAFEAIGGMHPRHTILNFLALPGGLGPAAVQPTVGIMGVRSDEWFADCAGRLEEETYGSPALQEKL